MENYVENLIEFKLEEIGNSQWLNQHLKFS